ncbi:MAG: hypothetical protein ACR2KZ_00295 [Segetibacter sp.]
MKKIIPVFTTTLIFAVSFIFTDAQKTINNVVSNDFKNDMAYSSVDERITETNNANTILYKINIKAVRDFKITYPDISNEKWEIIKDGYIASFVSNAVWKKNYYDKKGKWLYYINQYDETKLPMNVRASVKSVYYDYAITIVKEVDNKKNDEEPIYFVHLKYNDAFKIIKVCNDELEEFTFKE